MATQQLVLCDTNVLIEFYKNNPSIVERLKEIGQSNIALSVVTSGELIYGALNKKELRQILTDISHLSLLDIDSETCNLFLQLMTDYALSHKLTLPDALIAATALRHNIPLYTLNLKDFRFISNLKLFS
ncbi:MAG: type II toxin-antitoxin system VapC family toxin [Saprospiraceae bacterium]